jgi:hypothetical protein
LQQGYDQLSNSYTNGQNAINTGYGTASNLYGNLAASTGAGANAYGNASGANGASGLQQAMSDFHNSGQYGNFGFALTNGLQALDRTHAAAGNLNSGNADTDTLNYATGLANNTYNSYVAGLSPYLSANAGAVAGQANAATGQGNALNASDMALGNAANANATAQGASNAAATMNNYNVGKNILGAGMGVAALGLGAAGGAGGLTSGLGSIFGAATGNANGGTAANPLPGLTAADYEPGAGLFSQFGAAA